MPDLMGRPAPEFTLVDSEGRPWRLGEHLGEGPVLLVFNRGFT